MCSSGGPANFHESLTESGPVDDRYTLPMSTFALYPAESITNGGDTPRRRKRRTFERSEERWVKASSGRCNKENMEGSVSCDQLSISGSGNPYSPSASRWPPSRSASTVASDKTPRKGRKGVTCPEGSVHELVPAEGHDEGELCESEGNFDEDDELVINTDDPQP